MKNLEDKLQEACVKWFRYQYPDVVIFAIPNGGSRNPIEAAKLKRTGTLAGVADLFVMYPKFDQYAPVGWQYASQLGLFIELKVGKNKQTELQRKFQKEAEQAGYTYKVCRSFDEFKWMVEDYLGQR